MWGFGIGILEFVFLAILAWVIVGATIAVCLAPVYLNDDDEDYE